MIDSARDASGSMPRLSLDLMRTAGIVLAAGESRRMGEPKQLLRIGGRPLLSWVVAAACASLLDDVVVVLGAHADAIRDRVEWGRAIVVVNNTYAEGMSTSLRAGIASIGPRVDRAVIILGDQPDIDAETIDRLLETHKRSGLAAAALKFGDLLHPPVVLARELWGEIATLRGDMGCRAVIRAHPQGVAALAIDRPGGHPVDIDTPQDFRRLVGGQPEFGASSSVIP